MGIIKKFKHKSRFDRARIVRLRKNQVFHQLDRAFMIATYLMAVVFIGYVLVLAYTLNLFGGDNNGKKVTNKEAQETVSTGNRINGTQR